MRDVEIQRMRSRYHLAPSQLGQRQRLDRVLAGVLDRGLEQAMDRAGVGDTEEICIREIEVVIRIRLNAADADLEALWSKALADAIARGAAVRYPSLRAALWEMTRSVMAGNYVRAWAWRQLGFWDSGDSQPARTDAVREWARAMAGSPEAIVPIVRKLAADRRGAAFLSELPVALWIHLARAAVVVAGGRAEWVADAAQPGIAETAAEARRAADAWPWRDSLRQCTELAEGRAAVAALMLLAEMPESFSGRAIHARTLLDATAAALFEPRRFRTAPKENRPDEETSGQPARRVEPHQQFQDEATPRGRAASSAGEPTTSSAEPSPETSSGAEEDRAVAETAFGGLLFLLRLLEPADIEMRGRPVRWTLHQLAMALTGADEDDPGALAFSGLGADARPPSREFQPASEIELERLDGMRLHLREQLTAALDDPGIPLEEAIDFVCRRRAKIAADPGWIDAIFPLAEVSTAIRRAGLDLDPGFIRWLGVVVRFLYE